MEYLNFVFVPMNTRTMLERDMKFPPCNTTFY